MACSKEYRCPNTDVSLRVDYEGNAFEAEYVTDAEHSAVCVPFGLLVRVLERESRVREHILKELHEGTTQARE